MIEPNLPGLSVGKQCACCRSRGRRFTMSRRARASMNLDLMRLIDKQFLETPVLRRSSDDLAFAE